MRTRSRAPWLNIAEWRKKSEDWIVDGAGVPSSGSASFSWLIERSRQVLSIKSRSNDAPPYSQCPLATATIPPLPVALSMTRAYFHIPSSPKSASKALSALKPLVGPVHPTIPTSSVGSLTILKTHTTGTRGRNGSSPCRFGFSCYHIPTHWT